MPQTGASLAVRTTHLSKAYGELQAVDRLQLAIPEGQFFGLLGPNGSGKTTTIHMLTTLARPTSGQASVAGHDVLRESVAVRREVGLVFQESALDRTLTVDENLRFAGMLRNLSRTTIRRAQRRTAGPVQLAGTAPHEGRRSVGRHAARA